MKPLLPTLREKKRYLVFEVISDKAVRLPAVKKTVELAALGYLGELGCAKAGMQFLDNRWDPKHSRGMVRVAHTSLDGVKASLALIKEIDGNKAIVRSVGVSGILKKAAERYLRNTDKRTKR